LNRARISLLAARDPGTPAAIRTRRGTATAGGGQGLPNRRADCARSAEGAFVTRPVEWLMASGSFPRRPCLETAAPATLFLVSPKNEFDIGFPGSIAGKAWFERLAERDPRFPTRSEWVRGVSQAANTKALPGSATTAPTWLPRAAADAKDLCGPRDRAPLANRGAGTPVSCDACSREPMGGELPPRTGSDADGEAVRQGESVGAPSR